MSESKIATPVRAILLLTYLLVNASRAEIVLDGSLGGPSGALAGPNFLIDHHFGKAVGGNLFHSFQTFNIFAGQSATFTAPTTIENILSRVTGGSSSMIDGLISSPANLYFFNPSGVIFGPHASLDINGSFHVSTADAIRLNENTLFTATPSGHDAELMVADLSDFGFLDASFVFATAEPAAITINGTGSAAAEFFFGINGIRVPVGETVSIIGGDIDINQGLLLGFSPVESRIQAPGGRMNIVSVESPGEVTFTKTQINVEDFAGMGAIEIRDGSLINVGSTSFSDGGQIQIRGGQLTVDNSFLVTNSLFSDNLSFGAGGTIDISLHDSPDEGSFEAVNSVFQALGASGGNIAISGDQLSFVDSSLRVDIPSINIALTSEKGGSISLETGESGNIYIMDATQILASGSGGGEVFIQSGVVLIDGSTIFAETLGSGTGGLFEIQASELKLTKGTTTSTSTSGSGAGGTTRLMVGGDFELSGEGLVDIGSGIDISNTSIFAGSSVTGGDAGAILIDARELRMLGGTAISGDTRGTGRGADIELNIKETFSISGENSLGQGGLVQSTSTNESEFAGDSGTINIHAGSLHLSDGAQINTFSLGGGNGGILTLDVVEKIDVEGTSTAEQINDAFLSGIFTLSAGSGNAGNVDIDAAELSIRNGAGIFSGALGSGIGGDIDINLTGLLSLSGENSGGFGSRIDAVARSGRIQNDSGGTSGRINIQAGQLQLTGGGEINASTLSNNDAGDINIIVAGDSRIAGKDSLGFQSGIFSVTGSEGNAGNLRFTTRNLTIENSGGLATEAFSNGSGGDIEVAADNLFVTNMGLISTSANGLGNAGNIRLNVDNTLQIQNASIQTSTVSADGGNIKIDAGFLVHLNDSAITTSVGTGQGNGGNIGIDPVFVILENSRIQANAFGGDGGNVFISTDHFLASPNSIVEASSQLGFDGNVIIDSPDEDVTSELAKLPAETIDAASILPTPCPYRFDSNLIHLTVREYDVLPNSPYALQSHVPEQLKHAASENAITTARISNNLITNEKHTRYSIDCIQPIFEF